MIAMIEYIYNTIIFFVALLIFYIIIKHSRPKYKINVVVIPPHILGSRKNVRRLYKGPGSVVDLNERRRQRETDRKV